MRYFSAGVVVALLLFLPGIILAQLVAKGLIYEPGRFGRAVVIGQMVEKERPQVSVDRQAGYGYLTAAHEPYRYIYEKDESLPQGVRIWKKKASETS